MASQTAPLRYEICVDGDPDDRWPARFERLQVAGRVGQVTVLTGPVADQAALHDLLGRVHALGLSLVSVRRLADGEHAETPMTDSEVATRRVVETFFERLATGDPDEFTALLSDDIDWLIPGDTSIAPWVGRRSTRSGVADYLRRLRANAEPLRAEVQRVLVDGDMAIAVGEFASRMRTTGKVVESIFFAQFVVRDGLVVRYRLLEDSQAVVVALTP